MIIFSDKKYKTEDFFVWFFGMTGWLVFGPAAAMVWYFFNLDSSRETYLLVYFLGWFGPVALALISAASKWRGWGK